MDREYGNKNQRESIPKLQIPGLAELLSSDKGSGGHDDEEIGRIGGIIDSDSNDQQGAFIANQPKTFLLVGPSRSGKTAYCKEFLIQALQNNFYCIVISGAMTESQYKSMFPPSIQHRAHERTRFLNPFFGKG